MANKIKLKICTPSDVYKIVDVDRVQIPAYEGDITILPNRVPTVFILKTGFIRLIDSRHKDRYFIKSGIADYLEGICKVMTEEVVDYKDIDIKEYEAKVKEAETEDEKNYYTDIVDIIKMEKIREI